MTTPGKNLFLLPVLINGLGLMLAGQVTAQTISTVYTFTPTSYPNTPYTNSDGGFPIAGLTLLGSTLFGTTANGGTAGNGTIFAVNTDGTGFATLYSFTATNGSGFIFTNRDGASPNGLVLSGNTLYGTAGGGGTSGGGTVFKLNTNGFTVLHTFTNGADGITPKGGLILSNNILYGTTWLGGTGGWGTVFKLKTDGTGFNVLHGFTNTGDGAEPYAGLVLSGNTLYGTAGTVFKVNTDGTGFAVLHSFAGSSDGGPFGGLVLSNNTLYGTTGLGGNGTVFKLNTDGTNYGVLHRFTGADGANPHGDLLLSGSTLYGTAYRGGDFGYGAVFAVNTDGMGFTNLYSFPAGTDGALPIAGLILSENTLFGTTQYGGSAGNDGTVFSLSLPLGPPQLTIFASAPNVILAWPTAATGFRLQASTNFGSSAIWTTNLPAPVVVNGQNTVTNPISSKQQFFRLGQ